jgi:hypothetical protein
MASQERAQRQAEASQDDELIWQAPAPVGGKVGGAE